MSSETRVSDERLREISSALSTEMAVDAFGLNVGWNELRMLTAELLERRCSISVDVERARAWVTTEDDGVSEKLSLSTLETPPLAAQDGEWDLLDSRERQFRLWFFRDLSDEQRLGLFGLMGMPKDGLQQLGVQQMAFKHLFPKRAPTPPSQAIDAGDGEAEWQRIVRTYGRETPVDDLALVLFETWCKADPTTGAAQYPASYIATFADMARAALTHPAAGRVSVSDEAVAAAMTEFMAQVRQQDPEWTDDVGEEGEILMTAPNGDYFAIEYPLRAALTASLASLGGGE